MSNTNWLDTVAISSPCTVPWSSMSGDDKIRHCGQCRKNVYNLSEMTIIEAEALIEGAGDDLCLGYYRRADGTILTADCPLGDRIRKRKWVRRTLTLLAMAFAVLGLFEVASRIERTLISPFIYGGW